MGPQKHERDSITQKMHQQKAQKKLKRNKQPKEQKSQSRIFSFFPPKPQYVIDY